MVGCLTARALSLNRNFLSGVTFKTSIFDWLGMLRDGSIVLCVSVNAEHRAMLCREFLLAGNVSRVIMNLAIIEDMLVWSSPRKQLIIKLNVDRAPCLNPFHGERLLLTLVVTRAAVRTQSRTR